ncbi:hypothetical protein [Streptomyces alanosinicus]|uniref:Uncharacterized protein n=1 Tax=Streptomyces alanosinicus TaxID=68171 RepID=A0A918YC56_9ACTN|nr:hypothetical protein [Streptomyces alanosinicus]GHD98217.1 hypothetical protein GCM10010339_04510 [Streptomyces alanosinicus]
MSADRETYDMTAQTDIALLLADAADGVEIGTAPVQAVLRAGRRRRARRWAVASATALVVAGTTGALAVTGLPGGGPAVRQANEAKPPASAEARHVYDPQRTELAWGMYKGKEWHVAVQVWGAPRDEGEAARQLDAMGELGLRPADAHRAADLVGKTSYFATRAWGENRPQQVMFSTVDKFESYSGKDMEAAATRLGYGGESSGRLVVGMVAKTARQVTCHWKDGTTAVAEPAEGYSAHDTGSAIRVVDGFQGANWFTCVAPEGTSYASAEVTKPDGAAYASVVVTK